MNTRGLPPLFGFPWERRPNGESPGGLTPFVVTGAPVSKLPMEPLTVRWTVRNGGGSSGEAQSSLTIIGRGQVAMGPIISIVPGGQVVVDVNWTNNLVPGSYTAFTYVVEVTPGASAATGALSASDQFTLTIVGPRFQDGARVSTPGGLGTVNFSNVRLRNGIYLYEYLVTLDSGLNVAYIESLLAAG